MQDTGNKGEGERSVFTYTTDSETRSFRSIAQNIRARLATVCLSVGEGLVPSRDQAQNRREGARPSPTEIVILCAASDPSVGYASRVSRNFARHRKQGQGGMSVFTYVIADETRSFRSIAEFIQARLEDATRATAPKRR